MQWVCNFIHVQYTPTESTRLRYYTWLFKSIRSKSICTTREINDTWASLVPKTWQQTWVDSSKVTHYSTRIAGSRYEPRDTKTHEQMTICMFLVLETWQQSGSIFSSTAEYFYELCRVKIQGKRKSSQRYYTAKRLIMDLLSNTPNCFFFRNYNPIRRLCVARKPI